MAARAGFAKGSHNAKALAVVLETFQRDELFQISEDDLLRIAPALAHFGDRPHTKAFVRFDTFDRFASALVYFPADKFRGGLVRTLGQILKDALGGQITGAYPRTEEGQMTRILYTIAFPDGRRPAFDEEALQVKVRARGPAVERRFRRCARARRWRRSGRRRFSRDTARAFRKAIARLSGRPRRSSISQAGRGRAGGTRRAGAAFVERGEPHATASSSSRSITRAG